MQSPLRLQKIMHHDYSVTTQKQCAFNIDWRLALSLCRKYNNSQLCWQLHVQRSPMVLMLSQWEPERRVWEFPGIFHRQHLSQWVLPFYSNVNKVVHRLRFLLQDCVHLEIFGNKSLDYAVGSLFNWWYVVQKKGLMRLFCKFWFID